MIPKGRNSLTLLVVCIVLVVSVLIFGTLLLRDRIARPAADETKPSEMSRSGGVASGVTKTGSRHQAEKAVSHTDRLDRSGRHDRRQSPKADRSHFLAGHIRTTEGNPVSSATVVVLPGGMAVGRLMRVTTDASGFYRAEGLGPGSYDVKLTHDDYMPELRKAVAADNEAVDFVMRKIPAVSFVGHVLDWKTSAPLSAFSVVAKTGHDVVIDTKNPGSFTIATREGDRISLVISAPGYGPRRTGAFFVPSGAVMERTFRLTEACSVAGRVVDRETKSPVSQVQVCLDFSDAESSDTMAGQATGPDGKFLIQQLPSGPNTMVFQPPDPYIEMRKQISTAQGARIELGDVEISKMGATIKGKVVKMPQAEAIAQTEVVLQKDAREVAKAQTGPNGEFSFTMLCNGTYKVRATQYEVWQQVTLTPDETREVNLQVGGTGLTGQVTYGSKPVEAKLFFSQGGTGFMVERTVQSDALGMYRVEGLAPGRWRADIYAHPKLNLEEYFDVPNAPMYEKSFVIPDGLLVGRVVDSSGAAVEGAMVSVNTNRGTGAFERFKPATMETGMSAADGSFSLPRIPPGRYGVRAKKNGVGQAEVTAVEVPATGQSSPVTLKLSGGATGTLISTALSEDSGLPLKEAWCYLSNSAGRFDNRQVRDENGTVQISGLVPGIYQVSVGARGFSEEVRTVEIQADKTVTIDSVLYEGGMVRVGVRTPGGSFLPKIPVRVTPDDPGSSQPALTGETSLGGMFVSSGLRPGKYSVTVSPPDMPPVTNYVVLHPRQAYDLLVVLEH